MKTPLKNIKGAFTLIELLVVIAIIALLTGIVMTNLTGSKAKARDAKRVSDLGQIQLALELFFDRCKAYPTAPLSTAYACPTNSTVTFGTYMAQIPTSPSGTGYVYWPSGNLNHYFLAVTMEASNAAQKDSVTQATRDTLLSNPAYMYLWQSPDPFSCYNQSTAPLGYCIVPN